MISYEKPILALSSIIQITVEITWVRHTPGLDLSPFSELLSSPLCLAASDKHLDTFSALNWNKRNTLIVIIITAQVTI